MHVPIKPSNIYISTEVCEQDGHNYNMGQDTFDNLCISKQELILKHMLNVSNFSYSFICFENEKTSNC